jgi:3-oxoadipate enol-lactonase
VRAFRKHFRVITYDARGLGLSRDSGDAYTLRTVADDAVAILDHLKIGRSHVLGLSFGGMVAQEVAISHPRRVQRLVLAATTPLGGERVVTPAIRKAFGIPQDVDLSSIEARQYANHQVEMKDAGPIILRLSFNNPFLPWVLSRMAKRRGTPPLGDGASQQTKASATADTIKRLHLIQARTLVMVGTRDRIVGPEPSQVLASRIPNATLHLVRGASHAFNFEAPWRFNRPVVRFLKT